MALIVESDKSKARMGIWAYDGTLNIISFCCDTLVRDHAGMGCYVCRKCGGRFDYLSTKVGEVFTRAGAETVRMAPELPLDSPAWIIKWWAEKWLRTTVDVEVKA